MSRYQKVQNEKGIFKDVLSGHFYVVKHIKSQKYSKTFKLLMDAKKWRKDFHPAEKKTSQLPLEERNGAKDLSFKEVWEKYQKIEFPKLQKSSIDVKLVRCKFFDGLMGTSVLDMNPDFIDDYILAKKAEIMKTMKANRCNLDHELIELSAVFSFHRINTDYRFVNPVIKERHFPLGFIRALPIRNKKMHEDEISLFFEGMWKINEENGLFAMLAETQFFIAGRIQEPAAIKIPKIDMKAKVLRIDEAISWQNKTKTFGYFKPTKTERARYVHVTPRMERHFRILISRMPPECEVLFHKDGRPLHYYEIYKAYRRGLKASGLWGKYTATHIMRHSMAKQARIVTGTLDGAQAAGGWASIKQCEEYADTPSHLQIEAVTKVEERLRLVN